MRSGSEAGSYLRLIEYDSTPGLRVIKKKRRLVTDYQQVDMLLLRYTSVNFER